MDVQQEFGVNLESACREERQDHTTGTVHIQVYLLIYTYDYEYSTHTVDSTLETRTQLA